MMVFVSNFERTAGGTRQPRSDGLANRERLLASAAVAIRREGAGVPMSTIAADAGVGVGTLYRHYPSRDTMLAALTYRSFMMVLLAAQHAAAVDKTAIERVRRFLDETIQHGGELVLPMHGGPVPVDQATLALRAEVHDTLEEILRRGRHDGTIRADVDAFDIIMFGAMITQPLPTATDWKPTARRQSAIFLDALATLTPGPLPKSRNRQGRSTKVNRKERRGSPD
jgi:AcrR family transcriptional regulator